MTNCSLALYLSTSLACLCYNKEDEDKDNSWKVNNMLWLVIVSIDDVTTLLFSTNDADEVTDFVHDHFVSDDDYMIISADMALDTVC